jgi:hypothetical protein
MPLNGRLQSDRILSTVFYLALLLLGLGSTSFSQTNAKVCPELELISPAGEVAPDEEAQFAIIDKKTGKDLETANVKWTVSLGSIIRGNGTSRVTFLATKENAGANIQITAVIKRRPDNCESMLSDTFSIWARKIIDPVDNFGKQKPAGLRYRLDDFYFRLKNNPWSEGVWGIHFAKHASPSYRRAAIRQILDVIKSRRYDARRLSFYFFDDEDTEMTTLTMFDSNTNDPQSESFKSKLIKAEEISGKLNKLFPGK